VTRPRKCRHHCKVFVSTEIGQKTYHDKKLYQTYHAMYTLVERYSTVLAYGVKYVIRTRLKGPHISWFSLLHRSPLLRLVLAYALSQAAVVARSRAWRQLATHIPPNQVLPHLLVAHLSVLFLRTPRAASQPVFAPGLHVYAQLSYARED
jgi:hypothetical protein